jgi:hypothetical protein
MFWRRGRRHDWRKTAWFPRCLALWELGELTIQVAHSYELSKIAKEQGVDAAKERHDELESEYKRLMNPVRTANNFGIEEIVDPAHTRSIVAAWVEHVYKVLLPLRIAERSTGKISPVFY